MIITTIMVTIFINLYFIILIIITTIPNYRNNPNIQPMMN